MAPDQPVPKRTLAIESGTGIAAIEWNAPEGLLAGSGRLAASTAAIAPEFQEPPSTGCARLIIYLPPGYEDEPQRAYPVLYMQDGQNLFDGRTLRSSRTVLGKCASRLTN